MQWPSWSPMAWTCRPHEVKVASARHHASNPPNHWGLPARRSSPDRFRHPMFHHLPPYVDRTTPNSARSNGKWSLQPVRLHKAPNVMERNDGKCVDVNCFPNDISLPNCRPLPGANPRYNTNKILKSMAMWTWMLARRFAPICFHVIIFLSIDQPANNNFGPELSTPLLRRVLRNLAAFFRKFPAIQAKLRDIFAHDTPQI